MRSRLLALLLLTLLGAVAAFLTACSKGATGIAGAISTMLVCHTGSGVTLAMTIYTSDWPNHEAHGDVQLVDADGDGWVAAANACVPGGDCDDQDPAVNAGVAEVCDGIDNNCSGQTDEALPVVGTQSCDLRRDPARRNESAMGNLVADVMRLRYPGVEAALTNSGGLRQDVLLAPPVAGEQPGEIVCQELFSVLPFRNRTVILTLTGAQLAQALQNGVSANCSPGINTGRFPQVSGFRFRWQCIGSSPTITGMWKTPQGIGGPEVPIGPSDTIRLVTNDFMYGGGDGYAVLQQGTDVVVAGELLLTVLAEYVAAHPAVCRAVEGRIVEEIIP